MKSKFIDGILFVVVAIPGALIFVFASFLLAVQVLWPDPKTKIGYLVMFSLLGALGTLLGLRKTREWKYIFVFASIPLSIVMAGLAVGAFALIHPGLFFLTFPLFLFVFPYLVNKAVSKHYKAKKIP